MSSVLNDWALTIDGVAKTKSNSTKTVIAIFFFITIFLDREITEKDSAAYLNCKRTKFAAWLSVVLIEKPLPASIHM